MNLVNTYNYMYVHRTNRCSITRICDQCDGYCTMLFAMLLPYDIHVGACFILFLWYILQFVWKHSVTGVSEHFIFRHNFLVVQIYLFIRLYYITKLAPDIYKRFWTTSPSPTNQKLCHYLTSIKCQILIPTRKQNLKGSV